MDEILFEIIKNAKEIIKTTEELDKIENFENVDYSDVLTDIKWNNMVLKNRLNDLNRK